MPSELTPTYDSDTGQVILEGLPTGAAGEAALIPVPDLELVFDRADGRLARVTVGTGQSDSRDFLSDMSATVLSGLLGPQAPAVISDAARDKTQEPLSPDARLSATLSRLARLESQYDRLEEGLVELETELAIDDSAAPPLVETELAAPRKPRRRFAPRKPR